MAYVTVDLYDDADLYDTADFYDGPLFDAVTTVSDSSRWTVATYENDVLVKKNEL